MATIEPPLILCEAYSVAYNARLERLGTGVYSERDKRDEVYNRGQRVDRAKIERDRKRVNRAYDRTNREHDEAKRLTNARLARRDALLWSQFEAIRNRVMAANKIKPPGKTTNVHKWRDKFLPFLEADTEYRAYRDRKDRFDRLMDTCRSSRPSVIAGILASDDRATRHAKVRAYREKQAKPAKAIVATPASDTPRHVPLPGQRTLFDAEVGS